MKYLFFLACPLLFFSQACAGKVETTAAADGGSPEAATPTTNPPPPGTTPPSPSPPPPTTGPGGPPPPPSAGPPPPSAPRVFAFQRAFLGDTTRAGVTTTTAWKSFGYDLDGKVTTKTSTDVCTPAVGAGRDAQVDGNDGIDNAFGSRIVPILLTFNTGISTKESTIFQSGQYTHLLQIAGLGDSPSQTNVQVAGDDYIGAPFGGAPTFTTADRWPILASSLATPGNLGPAKTRFPTAYVASGTWVGFTDTMSLALSMGGVPFDISIHRAIVTFDHTSPSTASNGTIAGVLDTEEFIAGLREVAGRISESLCSGSAFDSIAQQIRQASDILTDGTNMPGMACNAISIGLGFEGAEVGPLTSVAPDPPPQPNPCP